MSHWTPAFAGVTNINAQLVLSPFVMWVQGDFVAGRRVGEESGRKIESRFVGKHSIPTSRDRIKEILNEEKPQSTSNGGHGPGYFLSRLRLLPPAKKEI